MKTYLCWCLGTVAFLSLVKSRIPLYKVEDPIPLKSEVFDFNNLPIGSSSDSSSSTSVLIPYALDPFCSTFSGLAQSKSDELV